MSKLIKIVIPDGEEKKYYKLIELKARLNSKNWFDFVNKITNPKKLKILLNEKQEQ